MLFFTDASTLNPLFAITLTCLCQGNVSIGTSCHEYPIINNLLLSLHPSAWPSHLTRFLGIRACPNNIMHPATRDFLCIAAFIGCCILLSKSTVTMTIASHHRSCNLDVSFSSSLTGPKPPHFSSDHCWRICTGSTRRIITMEFLLVETTCIPLG